MSLSDVRKLERESHALSNSARRPSVGPVRDLLGISFYLLHLMVCAYMLGGWMIPSTSGLVFYLVFLPLVAMQWLVNRGSCVISNIETLIRTRRWRDSETEREGRFVSTIALSIFGVETSPSTVDSLSFGAIFVLWVLGFIHLALLGDPALLSIFP
jgi:hypothetical protein